MLKFKKKDLAYHIRIFIKTKLEVEKMFVKSVMIPKFKCITISKDDTVKDVLEKLEQHAIDGMPVLDGDTYCGIVTRYDIYKNFYNSSKSKEEYETSTLAGDIALYKDRYFTEDEIFENTLVNLKNYPLLAVLNGDKKFIGVVTRFDVLTQFTSAFGMNRKGVRIAFTTSEAEGRLAKLSEIAKQFHEQIISLVTFDETDKLVRRIVIKIEKRDNIQKFLEKLESAGFRILQVTED